MSVENEFEDFDSLLSELEIDLNDPIDPIDPADPKKPVPPSDDFKVHIPKDENDVLWDKIEEEDEEDEDASKDKNVDLDSDPDPDDDDDDDDDDSSKYFEAVGKGLLKLGKFAEVGDDFKWTQESFLEKFDEITAEASRAKIDEILMDKWGEQGIEMFNDIFVKKVPVNEYLSAYGEAEDFSKLDIEKVANQKLIVKTYLENMGVDEDEIFEQIELLEEKEKLQDRAEKYKEKLIEDRLAYMQELSSKREAQILAQKKADAERKAAINEALSEALKTKEINGIPLSVNDGKDLFKFVTAPAYKLQSGQEITELDKRILDIKKDPKKLIALGKLLKEDLNVAPIKKKGADEGSQEVFDFVKRGKSPKNETVVNQLDLLFGRGKRK